MKKYFVPLFFMLLSCGNHTFDDMLDDIVSNAFGTGLMPSNTDIIPQDVKNFSYGDGSSLPSHYSLEDKFPPVQSQGRYGTCVAWSTGYAFKTALNAIEKNWTAADLAKPANQTSPKDLWLSVPSSKKGSGCNGTAFIYAMDALIANGASNMADVPYEMGNSCDASSSAAKGNQNNKLANYRKIAANPVLGGWGSKVEGMDKENFKGYLAQGRPILFAANVCDRFDSWKSSAVFSGDGYQNCGGHAMVLVGYDDSKGDNGAFRVRNSWGTEWGDKGSIWVDYDFFLTSFCSEAYVAQNPNSPEPNPNPPANIIDLLASFAEDYPDPEDNTEDQRARAFSYQVHNNGSTKILASQNWGVYYMYYNAYDADEYEIIFEDHYTDEYGEPCTKPGDFDKKVCYGDYPSDALAGGFWNNMDIEPGKKAGEAETGGRDLEIPYYMPDITGDYYLVVYADYEDVIKESNEDNNLYFITAEGGKPLQFEDGVMQSTPLSSKVLAKRAKLAPVHSVVDLGELNAYTPQEIKTLLNRDKKNGKFAKKVAKYKEKKTHPIKRIKRQ